MSDLESRATKAILIIAVVVLLVAYVNERKNPVVKLVPVQDPNYVQPPCEAQRRLKEQGLYHGRIDNIWGPESDKAFCDWCAIRDIEGR